MTRRGLLLTMTEPPPEMEEEFNAWYDEEHLPERLSIPGFRSARRWVAELPPGEGKYLATYELDSAAVLTSLEYLKFFERPTPWTRRCLGKTVLFKRWACEQIEPGDADARAEAKALAFCTEELLLRDVLQQRRFKAATGETMFLYELGRGGIAVPAGARLYSAYGT